jgi:hypothetical protein
MNQSLKISICWIFLFAILCGITLCFTLACDHNTYDNERMIDVPKLNGGPPKWSRTFVCPYLMNETQNEVMKKYKFKKVPNNLRSDIIFPCGYNNINQEIKSLPFINSEKSRKDPTRVFILDGADEVTAKNFLWKNIVNYHGLKIAKTLSPNTYLLSSDERKKEMERLKKDHHNGRLYILKKNIQRQTGLEITDSLSRIENSEDGYVVVQELLMNPYLVGDHKINLRVYILVVCYKSNTDVYMFDNGFMYYSPNKFVKGDISNKNNITSGYIDRSIYVLNPLTLKDFRRYLDLDENELYHDKSIPRKLSNIEKMIRKKGINVSDHVFNNIKNLLKKIFEALTGKICREKGDDSKNIPIYTDYSAQLFGADVAIDDKLNAQIIEINKGPDLSHKDKNDGSVKNKMVADAMNILGLIETQDNGFTLILES